MEYDTSHQDAYSTLSKEKLAELLQNKTTQIHQGYTSKQGKLHHVARRIFSHEKQVAKLHNRIGNYISPPSSLPIPYDMLNVIGNYLNVTELSALSQLNRTGNKNTLPVILNRAKQYGYDGQDGEEARIYLKDLFSEVRLLYRMGILSIANKDRIQLEKNSFIESHIRPNAGAYLNEKIFENMKIYRPEFTTIYKYFNKCLKTNPIPEFANKINPLALHIAVEHGNIPATEFFLEQGLNIEFKDLRGWTPLFIAIKKGDAKMTKNLLDHKADVNTQSTIGSTALMLASFYGILENNPDILKILLDKGADITHANNLGLTTLMYAAGRSQSKVVKLLLDNGADPHMKTLLGKTALDIALLEHNYSSAYLLYRAVNKS